MQPMVVVFGVMGVALTMTTLLAYKGQSIWAAVLATIVAVPLQLLGLTSTCTQGSSGTFVTGALLSAPFLMAALGLVLWTGYRAKPNLSAVTIVLVGSAALLVLTRDVWVGPILFGTPCGEDYAFYPSGTDAVMIVVAGYLALPLLLIAGTVFSALGSKRRSAGKSPS